jgi:hypothetical protein
MLIVLDPTSIHYYTFLTYILIFICINNYGIKCLEANFGVELVSSSVVWNLMSVFLIMGLWGGPQLGGVRFGVYFRRSTYIQNLYYVIPFYQSLFMFILNRDPVNNIFAVKIKLIVINVYYANSRRTMHS